MSSGGAFAHATLVLETVTTDPAPPRAGSPFTLGVSLLDLTQIPVEDARVLAELRRPGQDQPITTEFQESDMPGVYETTLTLPRAGNYSLLLRDQTYRQEEAQATLTLPVGRLPAEPLEFIFPPTNTRVGVWTWIGFLIGLPLVAAGVVTALVLLRSKGAVGAPAPSENGTAPKPQE